MPSRPAMLCNSRKSSRHIERLRLEPQRAPSMRERALPPRGFLANAETGPKRKCVLRLAGMRLSRGEYRTTFTTTNFGFPKSLPLRTGPPLHHYTAKEKGVSAAASAPSTTTRILRTEGVTRLPRQFILGRSTRASELSRKVIRRERADLRGIRIMADQTRTEERPLLVPHIDGTFLLRQQLRDGK